MFTLNKATEENAPVDVLQGAVLVVRHGHAQRLLHAAGPFRWHLRGVTDRG